MYTYAPKAQFARFAAHAGPNHRLCTLCPDRALPSEPDGVLFCSKCGAYSTAKLVGLMGPCAGRPMYGPARTRLKHMLNGLHPTKRWTGVSGPYQYAMGEHPAPVLDVLTPLAVETEASPDAALPESHPASGFDHQDPEAYPAQEEFGELFEPAAFDPDAAFFGCYEPM